jgi:phosphoribosylamine--glycine ligase
MKALVVGSGGREHALAWKLSQSPRVQRVFVAPGNGGTAADRNLQNVPLARHDALIDFVRSEGIGLTVVGPEAPLAAGIVDDFQAAGLRVFGPTRAAARLEWSKEFAKEFMVRHRIPTARHASFGEAGPAHDWVRAHGAPIVVKADGLAAGKGVVVAGTADEAHAAIDAMLGMGAGARVVIEEFLAGEEASFIVLADGLDALPLATSQDHKRLRDGDEGPNTGGMGAISPAPVVTPAVHARVMREVIAPTLAGMAAEGTRFSGFLYAGLMIGPDGAVRTLEFNCRMGDPETQPILMRMKSDLLDLLERATAGTLSGAQVQWDRRAAIGVVAAAHGYPAQPRSGDAIEALPADAEDCRVFHAGTRATDAGLATSGGRVLCVTALGEGLRAARRRAYEAMAGVRFAGMQFRTDIGARAIGASGAAAAGGRNG